MILVVMGVCGCGKSSVGQAIATAHGWPFLEGDDFHPAANKAKMAGGQPLDDNDRWPWLDSIVEAASAVARDDGNVVIACSALKRVYRDRLRRAGPGVAFLHLGGARDLIAARLAARTDHYMPPSLLDSQLAALETLGADEAGETCDVALTVSEIVGVAGAIIARQKHRVASSCRPTSASRGDGAG